MGIFDQGANYLSGGRYEETGLGSTLRGDDKKRVRAEKRQRDELAQAAAEMKARQPLDYAARIDALNQAAAMFEPANEQLGRMYGQGAKADLHFEGDPTKMPGYVDPMTGVAATPASAYPNYAGSPTPPKRF